MSSKAVQLFVNSGLVPKEALLQMRRWKMLPEEELGTPVASLQREWHRAEDFLDELEREILRERETLRETDFTVAGDYCQVWLRRRGIGLEKEGRDAVVDRLGRVFLPGTLSPKSIQGIAFAPNEKPRKVIAVEKRYLGDRVASLVCRLEP